MTKEEYIEKIEKRLNELYGDETLNNYEGQLVAEKLNSDFSKTYNIQYLWNKCIYLINSSCFLLRENHKSEIASKMLTKVGFLLENISEIIDNEDKLDLNYCKILAAICYDITGYQSNAFCLVNKMAFEYQFESNKDLNVKDDNRIILLIQYALLKKIPYVQTLVNKYKTDQGNSKKFESVLVAFEIWCDSIMNLKTDTGEEVFFNTYKLYLFDGNVYISQLLLLFYTRILLFKERSIYLNLYNKNKIDIQWKKYIKLYTNDYFDKSNNLITKNSIFEFWDSQISAINQGLFGDSDSYVVQMPTSAGKTFIAELFVLDHLITYRKKVLYISPFKALASEKVNDLGTHLSYLGYKVSSISGSYERDNLIDNVFADSNVYIFTPEKADYTFRMNPDFFNDISAIVIDEGHIVGDLTSRAALTELLIIKLKMKYPEIKYLFISAVMPDISAKQYSKWFSGNENNIFVSCSLFGQPWQPTRRNISCFRWRKSQGTAHGCIEFKDRKIFSQKDNRLINAFVPNFLKEKEYGYKIAGKKPETAAALGLKLTEYGNTLIFCGKPSAIESVGKKLLKFINKNKGIPEIFSLNENSESYFYCKEWFGEDHLITQLIGYGIGVHYGDLPEQIRSSVEKEYKSSVLRLLLCTNTIGQGVNFPIKNLIIYNLSIGYDNTQINISYRDFWNLIGRAGRAGKETEGNIYFIINSYPDLDLYRKFTNKENLEISESIISKAYALWGLNNPEKFDAFVKEIIETFLLDLIDSNVFEDDNQIIEQIVSNSLFFNQMQEENIQQVKSSLHKGFVSIKDRSVELDKLHEYGKTGLSLKDNLEIEIFISDNIDELKKVINNSDTHRFIVYFLRLLDEKQLVIIQENSKLNDLLNETLSFQSYSEILDLWINGKKLDEIKNYWNRNLNSIDFKYFYILLAQGATYIFPWICYSMLLIYAEKNEITYDELPEKIKNVSSYMKCGLIDEKACICKNLGIKNRNICLLLSEKSIGVEIKDFIPWLHNLNGSELESFDINDFEKQNIIDVCNNMTSFSLTEMNRYTFYIAGTAYNEEYKANSLLLNLEDSLNLERDPGNIYDYYALKIKKNEQVIGFVPREFSKLLSTEIDLNQTKYLCKVSKLIMKEADWYLVLVTVDKEL